ncbi:hypothetical protein BMETH_01_1 [methanotrophic bacterial endosymbiont of Bathymodiolus sp.]|nr:hypothetical protein BMETH_01_1 [methanotrophic bacterial endosymbiont of Bathymodiolus sp.]
MDSGINSSDKLLLSVGSVVFLPKKVFQTGVSCLKIVC